MTCIFAVTFKIHCFPHLLFLSLPLFSLQWLNEKQLIESIIRLLDPAQEKDAHDNASRLLIEIHRVARDAQHAPPNERCQDALLREETNWTVDHSYWG